MKTYLYSRVLLFILLLMTTMYPAHAQQADVYQPAKEDTSTLNNIIHTLYAVISGEKGEERNWDRFLNLFHEQAVLIPSGENEEGQITMRHITPKEYVERSGPYLVNNGFFENEINRIEEHFGSLTHIWSTYESRHSKNDPEPFVRGINSMQLMYDGKRWWVVSVYWTAETADNPIPEKYLPN